MVRYELYQQKLDFETYFSKWEGQKLAELTDALKAAIYGQYLVRCDVYQRDSFVCQNEACKTPQSSLTIHHIKAQRNGGEDKPRNMVTLCDTCHKGYERAKYGIVFSADATHLPSHIRGHTFKLLRPSNTDAEWKKRKKELKRYRKTVRGDRSWDISKLIDLLRFLGWID